MGNLFTTFTNCRQIVNDEVIEGERFVVSQDDGLILETTGYIGGEIVDLDDAIIAPGLLELHTNGVNGFHYTNFEDREQYDEKLKSSSEYYISQGVTGFWATVPTVEPSSYEKILPFLAPNNYGNQGASLLGAHVEGPYLHPSKPGAHTPSLFKQASEPLESIYGASIANNNIVKLATVAADIASATPLIMSLRSRDIRVSLGHSSATYDQGLSALSAGASGLTHTLNCMAPLHHREPGLAGLISLAEHNAPRPPYYSILADGVHLHPQVATLLFKATPQRAMLVSDSIELTGLPDGVYPGNLQIPHLQRKSGNKVTLDGAETLVGSCVTVAQCLKNMVSWSGDIGASVRAATENIADFMGVLDRGKLEVGRRADFVVLEDDGTVRETWIAGNQAWSQS